MKTQVPLLVISGSIGTGKTTVLYEVSDLLADADVAHAAMDLDSFSNMHPMSRQDGERLLFANLAAVWSNYEAAGARRLVVARVLQDRSELQQYRGAIPGAEPVVCRLEASTETMQERTRIREPGMIQAQIVARAPDLAETLRRARAEDFTVDNGEGRSVTDVAREVLSGAGWPHMGSSA